MTNSNGKYMNKFENIFCVRNEGGGDSFTSPGETPRVYNIDV